MSQQDHTGLAAALAASSSSRPASSVWPVASQLVGDMLDGEILLSLALVDMAMAKIFQKIGTVGQNFQDIDDKCQAAGNCQVIPAHGVRLSEV